MEYKRLFAVALGAIVCLGGFAQGETALTTIQRNELFKQGDMGSRFWRIPALATTNDGTVIAVVDKRNSSNRDLPNQIDLVAKRSTDSGMTWSDPYYVVQADSIGGYGDASVGIHRPTGDIVVVCAHGNGIWESVPENHTRLMMMRSTDDGKTWSEPVDITSQIFDPEAGVAPVKANSAFASSGAMLCDDQGRLSFVMVANVTDELWGPLSCYVCYSDDGGYTWKVSAEADDYGDEAKVTQLADGSYYMSVRNRHRAGRRICRSTDRGETWTAPRATHYLVDPACNGDLITITPEQLEKYGLDKVYGEQAMKNGLMLHSIADDSKERKNVSVFASDDLGMTWDKIYTVTPDKSSYSAITLMPDGTLGILSEEDNPDGGFNLWFTKISLNE